MDSTQLEILHQHYQDSCSLMQAQRSARDRYFYLVLLVVSLALFNVVAPQDFGRVAGEGLKTQFGLSAVPNLAYLRSILWFLLLGLTVRYFQVSLSVERSYDYIHRIEAVLAEHIHPSFQREGRAYLTRYPLFLDWAHLLYVVVVPCALLIVVAAWTYMQFAHSQPDSWPAGKWFDLAVSVAVVLSVGLYWAFLVTPTTPKHPVAGRKSAK